MSTKEFYYESGLKEVTLQTSTLETIRENGVSCIWNGKADPLNKMLNFTWVFDWSDWQKQGVDRVTGSIKIEPTLWGEYQFCHKYIKVDWTRSTEVIKVSIETDRPEAAVVCKIELAPYRAKPEGSHYDFRNYKYHKFWYKSCPSTVKFDTDFLAKDEQDEIKCVWNGKIDSKKRMVNLHWNFDWTKWKDHGVEGLTGRLIIMPGGRLLQDLPTKEIKIHWTRGTEEIEVALPTEYQEAHVEYELWLEADYQKSVVERKDRRKPIRVIKYESPETTVAYDTDYLGIHRRMGMECTWHGTIDAEVPMVHFTWNFNWMLAKQELKVDRITGHLSIRHSEDYQHDMASRTILIDWTNGEEEIKLDLPTEFGEVRAIYEMNLSVYSSQPAVEEVPEKTVTIPEKKPDKVMEYTSDETMVRKSSDHLEELDMDGIFWFWNGSVDPREPIVHFGWTFNWMGLKEEGVERITGHLTIKHAPGWEYDLAPKKIDIDWVNGRESVEEDLPTEYGNLHVFYDIYLVAHYMEPEEEKIRLSYEEMFAASSDTDAVLLVEGKKVYVNQALLSMHSEFFASVFSYPGFAEIPILNASYNDVCLLLSMIYPNSLLPNDKTTMKLLELAELFLMPTIASIVEDHLLLSSQMRNALKLLIADANKMEKLLEKCILSADTAEKMKALEKSVEYGMLSSETKTLLLNRRLELL